MPTSDVDVAQKVGSDRFSSCVLPRQIRLNQPVTLATTSATSPRVSLMAYCALGERHSNHKQISTLAAQRAADGVFHWTGKPVIPTAFACRRFWSFGTGWTDLVIPKPGNLVYALAGNGIQVPADTDRTVLVQYTQQIQIAMDRLDAQAIQLASSAETSLPPIASRFES